MLIYHDEPEQTIAVVADLDEIEEQQGRDGGILRAVAVCPGVRVDVDTARRVFGVMVSDETDARRDGHRAGLRRWKQLNKYGRAVSIENAP